MVSQRLKVISTTLTLIATVFAACVVGLGAYTRLVDAGLGCPDWPGCYGKLLVPMSESAVENANALYPERPLEHAKAWPEMIHRYAAGTLGLLILAIALISVVNRRHPAQPTKLPLFVLALVIMQAALGMWTVTHQLFPIVVVLHLLGGFLTFSLLFLITMRSSQILTPMRDPPVDRLKNWAMLGLIVVIMQITLGGWTAANYAAAACPNFPTCYVEPTPWAFSEAFSLHTEHSSYEYAAHLSLAAKQTIHKVHRYGAVVTGIILGLLTIALAVRATTSRYRYFAASLATITTLQIGLGIGNVIWQFPLAVAVAHNLVGAFLLIVLLALNYSIRKKD
ncbi:MAG: COX15/CtaA family protein [Pseudomonadota bacterium]